MRVSLNPSLPIYFIDGEFGKLSICGHFCWMCGHLQDNCGHFWGFVAIHRTTVAISRQSVAIRRNRLPFQRLMCDFNNLWCDFQPSRCDPHILPNSIIYSNTAPHQHLCRKINARTRKKHCDMQCFLNILFKIMNSLVLL